ncbi:MAG TPA: hypothetical protein PLQ56_07815 [Aggregatilineales bacterium]|nr:hypothetical protein [Aggregatilineales bacterium]
MATKTFTHRSTMPTTMERMTAFHEDPRALRILTPPPIFMQPLFDHRTSLTEGDLEFRLWFGPIPFRWHARHEPGPTPTSFVDRQISGPMQSWVHTHSFTQKSDGIELQDQIVLEHKPGLPGLLTRLMFDGLPLRILFLYRHFRTRLGTRI